MLAWEEGGLAVAGVGQAEEGWGEAGADLEGEDLGEEGYIAHHIL